MGQIGLLLHVCHLYDEKTLTLKLWIWGFCLTLLMQKIQCATDRRKKGYFCWLVMMTVMTVMIMVIMMVASIMIERNFHSGAFLFEKRSFSPFFENA